MIKEEERIALSKFYERLYEYFYSNFSRGRININYHYKKTDPFKSHPYWFYFPATRNAMGMRNVNLIIKFDTNQLGYEYKVDRKYYESLKLFFAKIESLKKFSKDIKFYECLFEESNKCLYIYIKIPHIDIHKDLYEQSNELTFLGNAIFDFLWFGRVNSYEILDLFK